MALCQQPVNFLLPAVNWDKTLSPDEYLPILNQALPGQDVALQRLTRAYMRVHYGDHPISEGELSQIRADFRAIQETPRQVNRQPV